MTGGVHLIVGNVGAGKSTFARRLAAELPAHIIANDPWFRELFFPDHGSEPKGYEWSLERTQRIERVAVKEAAALSALGVHVILDLGFFAESQRRRVTAALGDIPVTVHYLDVDGETRWARVEERNRGLSETYEFAVTRETFDFCETIFEPLSAAERRRVIIHSHI